MKSKKLLTIVCAMILSMSSCASAGSNEKNSDSSTESSAGKSKNQMYVIENDTVSREELEKAGGIVTDDDNYVYTDEKYGISDSTPIKFLWSYINPDGKKIFGFSNNHLPEWWDEEAEVTIDPGRLCLVPVIKRDDYMTLFRYGTEERLYNTSKEEYINDYQPHNFILKRRIPEGWRIVHEESDSYTTVLYNEEMDVKIRFMPSDDGVFNTYGFDHDKQEYYWSDFKHSWEKIYEKPDEVRYDVQKYIDYLGASDDYLEYSSRKIVTLHRRTEENGDVYIDYLGKDYDVIAAVSEEDFNKMQNAGKYAPILEAAKMSPYTAEESYNFEFINFCGMFLNKKHIGFYDPDSDEYYQKYIDKYKK